MTDSYIRGAQRGIGDAGEEPGLSLAGLGIPTASMDAWETLQGFFARGEVTPCAGRTEWTSNRKADKQLAKRLCGDCVCKAACAEFAVTNGESGATWGGEYR